MATHRLVGLSFGAEDPSRERAGSLSKLLQLLGEFARHWNAPLLALSIEIGAPANRAALDVNVLPSQLAYRAQSPSRCLDRQFHVDASCLLELGEHWLLI